jgi:NAD-dependent deacetylase
MRRKNLLGAEPNGAHRALARLEAGLLGCGGKLVVCTQNVDDLHERASSRAVLHMHGELLKACCVHCDAVVPWREDLGIADKCPSCGQAGALRPHVVWFGEMPMEMETIYERLAEADLFVAIGTSGSVYPAAGFVDMARRQGIRTCEINLEPSDNARVFDDRRYGAASETVPAWVDEMLGERR